MSQTESYRADIDGLRAIAVMAVVAYHAGVPWVSGGFVGVDVFFVISGFLITGLLLAEREKHRRISLRDFYVRRVRRILPAFLLVIVATLVLSAVLLYPVGGEQQNVAKSAISAVFLFSNHYFYSTIGYFSDAAEQMPLLHLWSLSVEEQFYLVWPVLFLFVRSTRGLLGLLIGIWLLSFGLSIWLVDRDQSAAFFLMPSRAWELATGAMLAVFLRHVRWAPRGAWSGLVASGLGLAAIAVAVFTFDRSTAFPGVAALLPVIGTALLIWGHSGTYDSFLKRMLSSRPFVFTGLISYSLYLWHWPLLAITNSVSLGQKSLGFDIALMGLAYILAWLTFVFIEVPFRQSGYVRRIAPWRTLTAGAAASMLTVVVSLAVWLNAKTQLESGRYAWVDVPAGDWVHYEDGCHNTRDRFEREAEDPCTENRNAAGVVALWGDSHGTQWVPLGRMYAERNNLAFVTYTANTCPPSLNYQYKGQAFDQKELCLDLNRLAIAAVEGLATSYQTAGVILGARWVEYLGRMPIAVSNRGWFYGLSEEQRLERAERFRSGFGAALERLSFAGIPVVAILPSPEPRFEMRTCLLKKKEDYCAISREEYLEYRGDAVAFLTEMASRYENLKLIDPIDYFCDETSCDIVRDGVVMFIDDNHISASAARGFENVVITQLDWLKAVVPDGTVLVSEQKR